MVDTSELPQQVPAEGRTRLGSHGGAPDFALILQNVLVGIHMLTEPERTGHGQHLEQTSPRMGTLTLSLSTAPWGHIPPHGTNPLLTPNIHLPAESTSTLSPLYPKVRSSGDLMPYPQSLPTEGFSVPIGPQRTSSSTPTPPPLFCAHITMPGPEVWGHISPEASSCGGIPACRPCQHPICLVCHHHGHWLPEEKACQ